MMNADPTQSIDSPATCSRGTFLKTGALLGAASLLPANSVFAASVLESPFDRIVGEDGNFVHGPLPYAIDTLEPHMDAETLELHHKFHHGGAVKGANAYYLKHRNRRGEFVDALFAILDWDNARARFEAARKLAG